MRGSWVETIAATGELDNYYLFHATRADLLRRTGRGQEAADSYRAALDLGPSEAERRFLHNRRQSLEGDGWGALTPLGSVAPDP
jgi:RNA polymerase sigma-70 factor (ECF subfamily)